MVVRDDQAGVLGGARLRLEIPDFDRPFATSTLLLTDEFLPADSGPSPLEADGQVFRPVGKGSFERGRRVAILYDTYNVPKEAISKTRSVTLLLRRRGRTIAPKVEGRILAEPERGRLRFVGYMDTSSLEPGGYDLLAEAPSAGGRQEAVLESRVCGEIAALAERD